MAHKHSIYDTDPHYVIDPITKAITTESPKVKLMQYDHNSERFTFEIPRYVDGHDMSLCNKVKVHFNNAAADKTTTNKDAHEVDDMQLSPDVQTTQALAEKIISEEEKIDILVNNAGITQKAGVLEITEMAEQLQFSTDAIPLGRLCNPEEVGDAALFLASDSSSYISGSIIDVNGGEFMR